MYFGVSLLIEVTKLYLVTFHLFQYKKVRRIKNILILSILCFGVFEHINKFLGGSDEYLTYMVIIPAVGIIIYALSDIKKMGEVFLFYMVISIIDITIAGIVLMVLGIRIESVLEKPLFLLVLNLINTFMLIIIIFCKKLWVYHQKPLHFNLTISEVLILLVGVASSGICIGLIQMLDYEDNIRLSRMILLIAVISIVILMAGIVRFMMQQRYYKTLSVLERKFNEQQQQYHKQLIEKDGNTKKFRHDISEHLYCIRQLCNQEKYSQLQKYIDDLQGTYEETKSYVTTGNYVVDVIANDLYSKYKEENIQLLWKGEFPEALGMTDMDVCSLFANLLKNAYEATEKVQESDRKICVNIKNFNSNFIISMSNPTVSHVQYRHNRILTTKRNISNHGFGTLIIQDILKKYKGEINYTIDHHIFKVEIVLVDVIKDTYPS